MANGERYITPALKDMENKVLGAEERAKQLEHELFVQLRAQVMHAPRGAPGNRRRHRRARRALRAGGDRAAPPPLPPGAQRTRASVVINGRHPVLEQTLIGGEVRAQRHGLDPDDDRLQILTGPNMAGKSHLHPPGRADHAAGADRRATCPRKPRRSAWSTASSPASARSDDLVARPIDLHGRDERDREHPQQRHRRSPGHPRRDRPRHRAPSTACASPGRSPSTCTTMSAAARSSRRIITS